MNRNGRIIGLLLVLVAIVSLVVLWRSEQTMVSLGLCDVAGSTCAYNLIINYIKPAISLLLSLELVLLVVLFSSEATYKKWRKFALWAIPIGIIILYLAPGGTYSNMVIGKDFSKETASWGVSLLFFLISLIIIAKSYLQNRRVR